MELYIFDRELNFIGILDRFTSLRWVRRYHKVGEFELQCALTEESINLLKREYIVFKKDDEEAGFIEYRNLKQNSDGSETLVIKGEFLTGYFGRRIIWGIENINSTVEDAMRTLVLKNCISATDNNRNIVNLLLGSLKGYTQALNYQVSYKDLLEELESLSNLSNLGYRIKFSVQDRKLIFDIYAGLDRTVNQVANPPAVFSKEFENILEQQYVDSLNNYRNVALVAGEGEDANRKMVSVGERSGLDRFEIFIDARDVSSKQTINNVETTLTNDQYNALLKERGNIKLQYYKEIQTFDSKVNVRSNLTYKVDFDLGDIVTCTSKKWGITLDARITEIEEIYESNGFSINIIFGNSIPTLIDKIKQKLK
jgi:hypothetical protein